MCSSRQEPGPKSASIPFLYAGKASGKKCCDRQEPCGAEGTEDADIEIGIPLCGVQDAMEAVKKLLEVIFGDGMTGTDKKGENGNE